MTKNALIIFLFFLAAVTTSYITTELAFSFTKEEQKEYESIFERYKNINPYEARILMRIVDYIEFLEKYPDSDLVDDVKLRIAEFYDLAGLRDRALSYLNDIIKNHSRDDYYPLAAIIFLRRDIAGLETEINTLEKEDSEDSKYKLKQARDKMIVLEKQIQELENQFTGEKTAAWALYWRGLWFTGAKDLERVIKEYPESKKAVRLTKEVLKNKYQINLD